MYRYKNNAFRIIGLSSDVSINEVIRRVNEIKVKKSLGVDASYGFDFPWMGTIDRSEQNVINALQRIENPITRIKEEIYWFWIDTDLDRKAIDCLFDGDRQAAHDLWRSVIASNMPEKKKVSALANQMILSHSSVIGREINLKYKVDTFTKEVCPKCNMQVGQNSIFCIQCGNELMKTQAEIETTKKRNINLSETHWKNWRFAISRICLLASNESFWERTREKSKRINDPRLSASRIQEIRDNFLSDIANPNFRFLSQSLVSKDYERTKQHAALLNGSSFPYKYLRRGFNEVLASHVTLIHRYCQNSSKEVAELDRSEDKSVKAIVDIYSKLERNVSRIITEGNLVDFNCISDYGLARDSLAGNVKNMAIVLNNMLVEEKRMPAKECEWGYQKAHEMVKKALEYAGSQYIKQKFAKDEELVKNNMEIARQNRTYYDQEVSTQSTSDYPGYSPSKRSSSNSKWKPFFIWGGILLFVVIIANLPEEQTNKKTYTQKTSSHKKETYSKRNNSSIILSTMETEIAEIKEDIKAKEARMSNLTAILKEREMKLSALKKEIDNIEGTFVAHQPSQYIF